MHRLLAGLARLWKAITRERAVITGLLLAVLEAMSRGEITEATAVPVIAGIVLRFFVSPYDRPALRGPELGDHADHADPEAFHGGRDVL